MMPTACWKFITQFFLLLWKSFILQIRRPFATVFDLIIPLFSVLGLLFLRQVVFTDNNFCFSTFQVDKLTIPLLNSYTVYYAPNSSTIEDLVLYIKPRLAESNGNMQGFLTESEFISAIQEESNRQIGCFLGGAAIYFDNVSADSVEYTLRLRSETYTGSWNGGDNQFIATSIQKNPTPYFDEGFLQLQKLIDDSIIEWKTGEKIPFTVDMKQLPYPSFTTNNFNTAVDLVDPLAVSIIVSFIYSFSSLCKDLVHEKEARLRETMKIMGLKSSLHFLSWFIKHYLQSLLPSILLAILLKYGEILPESSLGLIFLLMQMTVLCGIAFSFFLSVFLNSAVHSLLVSFSVIVLGAIPGFALIDTYRELPLSIKFLTCISPNSCMIFGLNILIFGESSDALDFSNFHISPIDDGFSLAYVFLMMIIDAILLLVLFNYLDAVVPGRYGVPKPFYFLVSPSFWCRKTTNQILNVLDENHEMIDTSRHEPMTEAKIGLDICGITKIYNKKNKQTRKVAVSNLKLKSYKDQITVLLGRNGAGKTTTMSILTGLLPPTSGTAFINGHNIVDDINLIRDKLGICPQHSVLFDRLTVSENLYFFGILKGSSRTQVKFEMSELLFDLELEDSSDVLAMNLSGGMKRKLSVAIALISQSEFVILDEPTSGMDPYSRRLTMDVLVKYKNLGQRTFLLSTHYMDEADIVADRIVVMSNGKVMCSGSPLFLKIRYGAGYYLIIEKQPSCDVLLLTNIIQNIIADAKVTLDFGAEVHFTLPRLSVGYFSKLLDKLEERKSELFIGDFGITASSLEDVLIGAENDCQDFVKRQEARTLESAQSTCIRECNEEVSESQNTVVEAISVAAESHSSENIHKTEDFVKDRNVGCILILQQIYAMLVKQLKSDLRSWQTYLLKGLLPIVFVAIGFSFLMLSEMEFTVSESDKFTVSLNDSVIAARTGNITLFWGSFGSDNPILFESINPADIGVTEFFNYTQYVLDIMSDISMENTTDTSRCCQYENQILDKYCASRSEDELLSVCSNSETFGYNYCKSCLSCSSAITTGRPATCTLPNYEGRVLYNDIGCPNPPSLSISERNVPIEGPLDSFDVYLDERLILFGKDSSFDYTVAVGGGFVIHDEDPVYRTCGCSDISETCTRLSPSLTTAFSTIDISSGTSCTFSNAITDCSTLAEEFWLNEYSSIVDACLLYLLADDCDSNAHFGSTSTRRSSSANSSVVTIWYSTHYYHMAPALLNLFHNIYLTNENSSMRIIIHNHPLPASNAPVIVSLNVSFQPVLGVVVILVGISIFCSVFIVKTVEEKQSNAQHLQFVSGINSFPYRISFVIYDFVTTIVVLVILLVLAYGLYFYGNEDEDGFAAIGLLMCLTFWSSMMMMYVIAPLFKTAYTAYGLAFLVSFATSSICSIFYFFTSIEDDNLAEMVHYVFAISPIYALGSGIFLDRLNRIVRELCSQTSEAENFCSDGGLEIVSSSFQFQFPGIGHLFVYLAVEIVICIIIVLIYDINLSYFNPFKKARPDSESVNDMMIDGDVALERDSVTQSEYNKSTTAIRLRNIKKTFRSSTLGCCRLNKRTKVAVNGISIDIKHGECFGLLGVNGAGKTTTFKILTGDIKEFEGTAIIDGYDLRKDIKQIRRIVGYCPQFDALTERLTGRELLVMYARIRGIKERDIPKAVETEINRLDLGNFADRVCGGYSGGNKRKLSTAIALVGGPNIVLLDEPTTGMDPVTRRFVWNLIVDLVKRQKSVIITSHSMEECEAVCTRMAIMVNGQFKCLGTSQHLKNKYGSGYTIELKLNPIDLLTSNEQQEKRRPSVLKKIGKSLSKVLSNVSIMPEQNKTFNSEVIKTFIQETIPNAKFVEEHQGLLTYCVANRSDMWHKLYTIIEENKHKLNLSDYSISQATLEQVFLCFAKLQHES